MCFNAPIHIKDPDCFKYLKSNFLSSSLRIYFINIPLSTFNNIYKFGGNYLEKKIFKHLNLPLPTPVQPVAARAVTILSSAIKNRKYNQQLTDLKKEKEKAIGWTCYIISQYMLENHIYLAKCDNIFSCI